MEFLSCTRICHILFCKNSNLNGFDTLLRTLTPKALPRGVGHIDGDFSGVGVYLQPVIRCPAVRANLGDLEHVGVGKTVVVEGVGEPLTNDKVLVHHALPG